MSVFASPFPPVDLPESALTPLVMRHAREMARRPALIDGPTGRSYTYDRLADGIHSTAGGLGLRGFGPGQVLGIMLPNIPEYGVAFHATAVAGGTVTTINPTYTADEVRFQLDDAGARFLVTVPMFLDTARAAAQGTGVEEIFVVGEAEGATLFTDLLASPIDQVEVNPFEDVVVLPYSSGTTGLPKGVMLTHHNLTSNLAQLEARADFGDDEVAIAVLPFFHIYGMEVLLNGALYLGGTLVTMPRFDLEQFLGLIQSHRVTRAYLVPPIILALAKHPMVDGYDLSSLRQVVSGAAPLSADLAAEASARIGCEVVQGYGLTETSPATHLTPMGMFKPGSVGITVSNTELRIVDPETGLDMGRGEDGEVWLRGPQVMKGYLNNPSATAAIIDDEGWLHTGDIGHVDDDDHLYIVDRLKELIKYKGFQVAPAELEGLLLTHTAVADSAVIGIPDEEAGELPKAFVVLKPGQEATAEELMEFVAGHVAHYKQLRAVELVGEIPKSASGKILRRLLRDRG